jgi:rhodanese-related sulfurtransferase
MSAGCEKDKVTPPFSVKTETNAEFLLYLEEAGDIINNIAPPLIEAEEVYNNLINYLIIDLRDSLSFKNGRIQGAKNISNDSVFNFVEDNCKHFSKVVMVSASGQAAAYYCSLFRLAGITNTYYMNYGMASWNSVFASIWIDRLRTFQSTTVFSSAFVNKGTFSPLPEIQVTSAGQSMEDLARERIMQLMKEGFSEDFQSIVSQQSMTFDWWMENSTSLYTICTGPLILYSSSPFTTNTYHLTGAVLYHVFPDISDLRSGGYLQTIPSAVPTAVYGATGQESAFYTAYLRLLGYNARSILFGENNIDYNMLVRVADLAGFAFKSAYIKNYPYLTGNQ